MSLECRSILAAGLTALVAAAAGAGAPAQEPGASSPAYEEVEVKDGGAISGVVTAASAPPKPADVIVTKDHNVCGQHKPVESVLRSSDGGLKNVVVAIEEIGRGKAIDRTAPVRLDNHYCQFVPHVAAMAVGQRLEVTNSDPVLHNTHAYLEGTQTVFNVALPIQNQKVPKTIKKPGLMTVKCDAGHTWMLAYVKAFEHPYFAVTDEKGGFRIADVPPGRYRLSAWHEELGTQTAEVAVAAGQEAKVTFDRLAK